LRADVVLCERCKRDILPQMKGPSWHKDVHRTAAKGMARPLDPRAERIRAKKDAKRITRATVCAVGIAGAAKMFIETKNAPVMDAPSEECPKCQQLIRSRSAA
jgi:hypothetical protein